MTVLTLPACAKINLTLDVGARRDDGYHAIRSVMQTIALHDTLTVRCEPAAPGIRLTASGPEAGGMPTDASNLAVRAAARVLEAVQRQEIGLHLHLDKQIPSQAGLGGGSSDAAAALRAVNQLLGFPLGEAQLSGLAATLGADVAFFLTGGTALAEGLGERITPLPPLSPDWDLVIARPSVGISTARAYAALDAWPDRRPGTATDTWLCGQTMLGNDFQPVAEEAVPEIARLRERMAAAPERLDAWPPLLCGSGSALFCRVRDGAAGAALAARLRQMPSVTAWATQTVGNELENER